MPVGSGAAVQRSPLPAVLAHALAGTLDLAWYLCWAWPCLADVPADVLCYCGLVWWSQGCCLNLVTVIGPALLFWFGSWGTEPLVCDASVPACLGSQLASGSPSLVGQPTRATPLPWLQLLLYNCFAPQKLKPKEHHGIHELQTSQNQKLCKVKKGYSFWRERFGECFMSINWLLWLCYFHLKRGNMDNLTLLHFVEKGIFVSLSRD